MAQERPSAPEKQLLRLIEDPKAGNTDRKNVKRGAFGQLSVAALKGRFSFFREKLNIGAVLKKRALDLRIINRVLKVSALLLALYLGGNIALSARDLKKVPDLASEIALRKPAEQIKEAPLFQKDTYYIDKAKSRDIFKFYVAPAVKAKEAFVAPKEKEKPKISELIAHLRLVGIAWSDEPDAMVEDASTSRIHFLKRGDWIGDNIKVEAIFRDRVIVSHEGEEAELR